MKKRADKKGIVLMAFGKIYYEIYGEGIPVFMFHGNGGSHRDMHEYAYKLSEKYKVVLMDSRGHGRSVVENWGGKFTAAEMAEDAKKLMDYIGIKKAFLLGFSDGANTALEFAVKYPQNTLGVVSVSGNALPSGVWRPFLLYMKIQFFITNILKKFVFKNKTLYRLEQSRNFASLIINSPSLTAERLKKIQSSVLLIAGTWDIIKIRHTKWMARQIPQSRLILIKHGTHCGFFYNRKKYIEPIIKFFDEKSNYENIG